MIEVSMFHNISASMQERMSYLESVDHQDRQDGTPRARRLRQIPPETGKLLALLAASAPVGAVLEFGTSGGYSSLWLALACRKRGDLLTTFEKSADKIRLAGETFRLAGVEDIIEIVHGDGSQLLAAYQKVAFCFIDVEKDLYTILYEGVIPNMVPGGIFCADNAISHQEELAGFIEQVYSDARVDALVIPIGKGVLVCRKA